jgi:hypothetical protein
MATNLETGSRKLAGIAEGDREIFFRYPKKSSRYENRFRCSALCQGAALHYLDRKTGVKDFDIFMFFAELQSVTIP